MVGVGLIQGARAGRLWNTRPDAPPGRSRRTDWSRATEGAPMDFNEWNKQIIAEFRANDGQVGGDFEGKPLLILHTTGRKSGQPRENPLMYRTEGERMYVFASKGGMPDNPDWYYNLTANPDVRVEVGADTLEATATVVEGAERDRIYAEQAAEYPQFGEYQQNTERVIPVIALEPKA